MRRKRFDAGALLACVMVTGGAWARATVPPFHLPAARHVQFRFIGPPGNRVSAVAGVPGDLNVDYAGAASGGVWKSVDGGDHWRPIFDQEPVQSIGSIAIAPSDSNTVWVGTGEPFIRSNVSIGDGIYKSTDAGRTWRHMGLSRTGRIARIVINPRNPNVVLACAMGSLYGPQQQRGVFRTVDGGKTWQRVLFVDPNTGCSDLAMDPKNPDILFAGTWQMVIHTWGADSGGPGSGVYVSRDGGSRWTRIVGHGLPSSPLGKIAVAIAPSNPRRVYALIETGYDGRGTLWRSDDGGRAWQCVNWEHILDERPPYTTRIAVSPVNDNEIWFLSNFLSVSYDGGYTTDLHAGAGDTHDMWIDPTNPDRMMIGYDEGVAITTTHGRQWNQVKLPNAQIYHVAVDDQIPYDVYSNMQDDQSDRGPSNSRTFAITPSMWRTTAGCESGFSVPTPNGQVVYGSCYSGSFSRWSARTNQLRGINPWPDESLNSPAGGLKYRFNWTPPVALSPRDPANTVYVGSQYLMVSHNAGQRWKVISPDLTRDDHAHMGPSGGLSPDNLGVYYWGTLFSISLSRLERGLIWTGSNDGLVHVTRDGGKHWQDVTPHLPGYPKYGTISNIAPSPFAAGSAYISVNAHQLNDPNPYIYRTTDYGTTWTQISSGIPKSVFSYVHNVIEDPFRRGMLYAGTENSLYVSYDYGRQWMPLQLNLPHAPVSWLTIQKHFDDLVVATKGRGIWILDDLRPLQRLTPAKMDRDAYFFAPRDAYRFRKIGTDHSQGGVIGRNPPYGADLNFYLKGPPRGKVAFTILDARGQVVRKFQTKAEAGINRVWWNLRYNSPRQIHLLTTPSDYPQVWREKRFWGKPYRTIVQARVKQTAVGPLAAPGVYTMQMSVDGEMLTRKLTVLKDPHSAGNQADIEADVGLQLKIRKDINTIAKSVNEIERIRKHLEDQSASLQRDPALAWVVAADQRLDRKLQGVENQFFQKTLADGDLKTFRAPMKLYLKYLWLYGALGSGVGDTVGDPDFPPTDQEVEVYALLHKRLENTLGQYRQVLTTDVPAFNNELKARGLYNVIVTNP